MQKKEIAHVLEEISTLLELKGENSFRVRAYRNGARALLSIDEDLAKVVREGKLDSYEGIGAHLAEKITEMVRTGKCIYYERLKKSTPAALLEMIQLQGIGPKKAKDLYKKLKIRSVKDLKKAAVEGKIAKLKGFGAKSTKNILQSVEHREIYQKRSLWWDAWNLAAPILEGLKKCKGVKRAEICGSLRRKLETVGDLDFLVGCDHPKPVMDWFISLGKSVIASGNTKSSIRLPGGVQADLRIVPVKQFAFALIYFTGSKEHNIKLRTLSLKKGWSLSEYGFEPQKRVAVPKIEDEKGLYKTLGFSFIPPELRENLGEFEAAKKGLIPHLIEESDVRGTFHNHTTSSDGKNTLREMVEGADKLGWEYIGISDHSKSSFQANGLSEEKLLEQVDTICKLNASKKYKTRVFAGTECDILPNGSLDYSKSVLEKLDFVIASVHSSLTQDEKTMTKRIIKALEHPLTTMLGHVTCRLLLQRNASLVNLSKVIDAAIANRKIIELNGHPMRLDMDWRLWHEATKKGLLCCINCDAHAVDQLEYVRAGVNIARKGWLTKKDVINTLPLRKIVRFLKTMRE